MPHVSPPQAEHAPHGCVRDTGELENTVICIASDHGDMLGDHSEQAKSKPWQGSASVPLVCSGPGIARGQNYTHPVTTLDLAGTFLDFAGLSPTTNMTTKSLRGLLENPSNHSAMPRTFVSSGLMNWRMVVKEFEGTSYKLICCKGVCPGAPKSAPIPQGKWSLLLYDVLKDPFDMVPLEEKLPNVVGEMKPLLPEGWCQN